jgi:uncharacterized membrane protein YeaQ/YmgE (transglycosylase-associated protein family)
MIWYLVIGGVAGWLAGKIMKGSGFGIIANVIIGVVGGFIGGWVFEQMEWQIAGGSMAALIRSLVGAIILIGLGNLFAGKK